jgi:hypothetical protein
MILRDGMRSGVAAAAKMHCKTEAKRLENLFIRDRALALSPATGSLSCQGPNVKANLRRRIMNKRGSNKSMIDLRRDVSDIHENANK